MTFSATKPTPAPPRPITPVKIAAHHLEQAIALLPQITDSPGDLSIHLQKALLLIAGLDDYLERSTTPESPALSEIAQKTQHEPWQAKFDGGETEQQLEQEMLTGHLEGQVLKMFVRMTGAKRVLDIGMFTGYSALAMAEALPDDGCLVACEIDPYAARFAQGLFEQLPHGDKIEVKLGAASDTLDQLMADQQTFDFAFLDANKAGYADYYEKLVGGNLLAPNGYICADNTLFLGEVYLAESERSDTAKALAHFNQVVADDPRTEQVLLPLRDGLTLIRRV
ncbi:SAM-dependent methyltransferase [filamentous cyanobacterium CCT1]|nr:SAM-dependent methyltransferase [filamentous cyanobacterium CCT1]PSN77774.1 SAM-dependent methyltransferase [filamentous cyanobacterium CCP4]